MPQKIDLPEEEQRAVLKEAMKESLREWLDGQFAAFGKWTMAGIASCIIGGLAYFVIVQGMHR